MPIEERIQLAIDSRRARQGAASFEAATKRAGAGARRLSGDMRTLDTRFKSTGSSATSLAGPLKGLVAGFSALLIIRDAINVIKGFEETMATVRGVTRASSEEFEALSQVARELGATTRFSAQQAGDALLFLARAGFTAQEAIAAVPSTLNLAQAGMLDLGTAADIASNLLSQFGLKAAETVRIVDDLIIVSNRSNTNVMQLAEAMKFAGPIAGALGVSVEETAAAIGVLGDSGIQASLAGTGLRMVMLRLTQDTPKVRKALAELGLTLDQVNPAKVGLTASIIELQRGFKSLKDQTDVAGLAGELFGARTAGAALQLIRGREKMEELIEAQKEFKGEALEMARIMDDTMVGAFKNLRSAIEELFISLGGGGTGGATGALRSLVEITTDVIRVIVGMEDSVSRNLTHIKALVTAVRLVTTVFSLWIGLKLIRFMGALITSFAGVQLQANLTAVSLGLMRGAFLAFMKLAPLVLLVGMVEAFRAVRKEIEGVSEALSNILTKGIKDLEVARRSAAAAITPDEIIGSEVDLIQAIRSRAGILEEELKVLIDKVSFEPGLFNFATETVEALAMALSGIEPQLRSQILLLRKEIDTLITESEEALGRFAKTISKEYNTLSHELESALGKLNAFDLLGREAPRGFLESAIEAAMRLRDFILELQNEPLFQETGLTEVFGRNLNQVMESLVANVRDLRVELATMGEAAAPIKTISKEARNAEMFIEDLRGQVALLTAALSGNAEAFQRSELLLKAFNLAVQAGVNDLNQYMITVAMLLNRLDELNKELEQQSRTQELIDRLARDSSLVFQSFFSSIIDGSKSASDALRDLASSLLDVLIQQLAIIPLANMLGGLFGGLFGSIAGSFGAAGAAPAAGAAGSVHGAAHGAVINHGLVELQHGAILSGPTFLGSTRTGQGVIAGERGIEAVLPLTRIGPDLGIKATGIGNTINVSININGVQDVDSFRKSRNQLLAEMESSAKQAFARI